MHRVGNDAGVRVLRDLFRLEETLVNHHAVDRSAPRLLPIGGSAEAQLRVLPVAEVPTDAIAVMDLCAIHPDGELVLAISDHEMMGTVIIHRCELRFFL